MINNPFSWLVRLLPVRPSMMTTCLFLTITVLSVAVVKPHAEETIEDTAVETDEGENPAAVAKVNTEEEALLTPTIAPNVDLKEVAPVPTPTVAPAETPQPDSDAPPQDTPPVSPPADLAPKRAKKFVILGAQVPPGTATRLAWSPDVTITGLALPTPVLVINGKRRGQTLCLTAAIHGDELNGIEIVRRVMYDIDPGKLAGKIIGIPIVNLQGFQRGSRYLPDRRDLNRFFPGDAEGSLAARIAYSLFNEVIIHCDALIDLHTGSFRRNNLPQVRADMRNRNVAEFTEGFDEMAVVHDAGAPGMLRYAAVEHGITAVTLETGESLRLQERQVKSGVKSINSLLERQKMYSRFFSWGDPEPVYYQSRWLRAERGGILFSKMLLGDGVEKGDVLGTVTDPITNETTDIVAPVSGRIIGMAVNQVVMHGFAAYHIGIPASEQTIMDTATSETTSAELNDTDRRDEVHPEE